MSNTPQSIGKFTDGTARITARSGYDEQRGGEATYSEEWTVTLEDGVPPVASQINREGGGKMPQLGDAASTQSGSVLAKMFVSSISWRSHGPLSRVWTATVKYSPGSKTASSSSSPGGVYFNKRWGFRTVAADLTQDAADGRAVVNSAGEPFDSVPQRDMFCPVISFSMLSSKSPADLMEYNGTVNAVSATVLGVTFAPHCARLSFEARNLDPEEISGVKKYEYQVTFEGASTPYASAAPKSGAAPAAGTLTDIGWDVSALDCGYCERINGDIVPILLPDADGNLQRPQSPVPLDQGVYSETDTDLHYLKFAAYPEATWPAYLTPST